MTNEQIGAMICFSMLAAFLLIVFYCSVIESNNRVKQTCISAMTTQHYTADEINKLCGLKYD